jgi:Ca-activated chloride channel family protein
LFVGQDLTLFVRYHGAGATTLTFEGDSPAGPVEWTERVTLPDRSRDNSFVAKLWAVQRVGWLSAERRRSGTNAELDNELRDLGTKYGIPTELSSYLVVEPGMQVPGRPRVEQGVMGGGRGGVDAPKNEFAATRAAAEQRAAKSLADAAPAALAAVATGSLRNDDRRERDELARQVGDRTFVQRDGRWTDTRFRESVRRVSVRAFSPAYFALVDKIPDLKAIFALGEKVTAGGRNVVVMLDAQGAEQLSASDLAAVLRDW